MLEPDGRIGFLGRLDRQVKVQGQRVEIGEIESVLRAHPDVRHAVVDLAAGPGGLAELTAYLAPESAPAPTGSATTAWPDSRPTWSPPGWSACRCCR
nr:hypothetical protein GCM10020093_013430 [Planobispora longispora]